MVKKFEITVDGYTHNVYGIVNKGDRRYHNHAYLVTLSPICPFMLVYADSAGDALDEFADYALDKGWAGLFVDESDYDFPELERDGAVTFVGNYSKPVMSDEIVIVKVY